jgi:ribose-phosphate pyrophosphokinase
MFICFTCHTLSNRGFFGVTAHPTIKYQEATKMIRVDNSIVNVERYPAGEQRIRLEVEAGGKYFVDWRYEREEELVTLIFVCGHIKTHGGILDVLYMPYFPNARMDRAIKNDEVFTLKYFSDVINSLGFAKVYINNPHSDVCMGLVNRSENAFLIPDSGIAIPTYESYNTTDRSVNNSSDTLIEHLIKQLKLNEQTDILFYPDSGCAKKYEGVLQFPYLIGHKLRDWRGGKIIGLDVVGEPPKAPFNALIIDDISSYGGTFLHSAKKLKELGAEKIFLFVTHCENSIHEGDLIKSGLLERIFITKSIYTGDHPLIEVIGG